MTNRVKTARPQRAPFDSQFAKEESHVRRREGRATQEVVGLPASTRSPGESVTERTQRIEHKVATAGLLLRKLAPTDPRARLLGSAMLRRDETLLDAVLGEMADEVVSLVAERWRAPR